MVLHGGGAGLTRINRAPSAPRARNRPRPPRRARPRDSECSEAAIQPPPMSRSGRRADHSSMVSNGAIKVFLAEDSQQIRERLCALLGAAHIDVVGEGATPDGCIAGILRSHPDVVVLDVQLEGGSGLQVLKAVRAADPEVAFVVFSNNSAAAYRKRYLGEGAVRFLDKSTEFDQLAHAVATAGRRAVH